MSQVAITRCKDYNTENVQKAVNEAVGLVGGIEKFVKPGQKVLIKPNMLSARPPKDAVCTHPEVLRAVIRLVKKIGGIIYVGDSPGGFELINTDKIYEISGIKDICQEEDVMLITFDSVIKIEDFPLAKIVKEVDVIISIPKMKTHSLAILTGAVKNMFGVVVGKYKAECHFKYPSVEDFCSYLVGIFSHARPSLTIMDAVVAMEGDGPASGVPRDVGLILASPDAVAVDSIFAKIVGLEPMSVLTTMYASQQGLGTASLSDIEILGEPLNSIMVNNFALPQPSLIYKAPAWVIKIFSPMIKSYPFIKGRSCVECHICEQNCPARAIDIDKAHTIDYSKCIFCFCCQELCPEKAVGVRKSLAGKFFDLVMRLRRLCH